MQSPDSEKDEMTEVAEGEYVVLARSPRRRETLTPSMRKSSDSSISLVKGRVTRKWSAAGGRWGMVLKKPGSSRREWMRPWRMSRWRWMVSLEGDGEMLLLVEQGERKAYER